MTAECFIYKKGAPDVRGAFVVLGCRAVLLALAALQDRARCQGGRAEDGATPTFASEAESWTSVGRHSDG